MAKKKTTQKITIDGKNYIKAKSFATKREAKSHAKSIKSSKPKSSVRIKSYKFGKKTRYGVYARG